MSVESYPPPFRNLLQPSLSHPVRTPDSGCGALYSDPIPVVDLRCLELGDCKLLEEPCKQWGLFRLVNHGVPQSLLRQLHDHARTLFSLNFESKQALIRNPLSYFWGTPALTPTGAALSIEKHKNINLVEGLNVPLCQLSRVQSDDPIIASFCIVLEEYGRHLGRIGRTLYEGMSKNLSLDPNESDTKLSESTGLVRVYRYPQWASKSKNQNKSTWGMDVHTDSSVLSILNQDEVDGLEVLKDNQWFTVKPIPNTLVVNLGDMMQAISDDKYKSVKHRVKVNEYRERISICYFVFPDEGSVIQSSIYKPFTYSDFQGRVQQDIKTIGYKVGLDRFKRIIP
ncbi:gibberellin 2-beta-dioxygenase 6-like [Argentina anserina]|uniref:gibberellin 2-beta-dioxygenase 6-like n=1 Tax=Argentina anserina TaxID=57926 RepID=UPI0021767A2A|nr:gibberellin 2-beta-dioxygenase 6-like [Potentilla anserina]